MRVCLCRRLVALATLALGVSAMAADWPQWRGPRRDGVCRETAWTAQWPEGGPPRLWEAQVGEGLSAVAVVDGRVYTMGKLRRPGTQDPPPTEEIVWCLEAATGKVLWQHAYPGPHRFRHDGPCATPTVADGRVFAHGRGGELVVAPASPEGFRPLARAKALSGPCWTVPVLCEGRLYCRNHPGRLVCLDVSPAP